MALDPLINPNQTDAKSPIDQLLMDSIRENLENFDTRITLSAGADFSFRVNGNLNLLNMLILRQIVSGLSKVFKLKLLNPV